jgi:hypothetical protein
MYKMNVLEKFIVQNSENPFMIVVHKTSNMLWRIFRLPAKEKRQKAKHWTRKCVQWEIAHSDWLTCWIHYWSDVPKTMLVIKKPYAIEIKPFNLSQNVRKWKKHAYLVIFIMYKMNVLEKFIVQNSERFTISLISLKQFY